MIRDYAGLRALALGLGLPEVADATAWGHPCVKAHDKMWAWWSPYVDAALFHAPHDEGEVLRAADPQTFLFHPHYAAHPLILVAAGRIDPGWAAARLTARWRALAPKRWLREWDARGTGPEGVMPRR